jgi:hypothetical protein
MLHSVAYRQSVHYSSPLSSLPRLLRHAAQVDRKQSAKTAKAVLYAYRVLLTDVHLLRTGEVEANVLRLNESFTLSCIDDLIAMKTEEKVAPADLG